MISFFFEDYESFVIQDKKLSGWISECISSFNFLVGDITIIFCSDKYLLSINQEYLNHDYYTDIITFNYNEEDIISGDLFISLDRVYDNAKVNGVNSDHEFLRVIIHGVLHLLNFNDKTEEEVSVMREKESLFIEKYLSNVR